MKAGPKEQDKPISCFKEARRIRTLWKVQVCGLALCVRVPGDYKGVTLLCCPHATKELE